MGRRGKAPNRHRSIGRGKGEGADVGNADKSTALMPGSIQDFGRWGRRHRRHEEVSSFYSTSSAREPPPPDHGDEESIAYEFDLGLMGMESASAEPTAAARASNQGPVKSRRKVPARRTAEYDSDASRFRIKCPACTRTFSDSAGMQRHRRTHSSNPNPFVCDVCGKRFTQSFNLTLHKRKAHAPEYEREQKEHGGYRGKNWEALTAACRLPHVNPDAEIQFRCNICGKGIKTRTVMVCHLQRYHQTEYWAEQIRINPQVRILQCPKCPAKFTMNCVLKRHVKSAHHEKTQRRRRGVEASQNDVLCQLCPMTFRRQKPHLYDEHMRYHARRANEQREWPRYRITPKIRAIFDRFGVGSVARLRVKYLCRFDPTINLPRCNECGLYNTCRESLITHKRRHHSTDAEANARSGSKLLQCLYCPRQSKSEETLRRHVREVHEQNRQYESKYCPKVFRHRTTALEHNQGHERRGICMQTRNNGLLDGTRARNCQLCGQPCQNELGSVQHFLKKHGGGGCKVELQRLKIKPVDASANANPAELGHADGDCVLCTVCGNWFRRTEFKIHLALTSKTCGSDQDYQQPELPEAFDVEEPEPGFHDIEASPTKDANENFQSCPSGSEFDDFGFDFGDGIHEREPIRERASPEFEFRPSKSPTNSEFRKALPDSVEVKDEPEPEVIEVSETDTGVEDLEILESPAKLHECRLCDGDAPPPPMLKSDLTRHILDQHLQQRRVSVSLRRMQFKPFEHQRFRLTSFLSLVRPSEDCFNIPWYICGKCGRAFMYRHGWEGHRLCCPRQYDFAYASLKQDHLQRAALELQKPKARAYPGGWTDRWDTNLLPEKLPHPNTLPGIVMVDGAAFCRVCLKHFIWCWGIQGHMEQHEYEAAAAADPKIPDASSRWRQLEGGRVQCTVCQKMYGPSETAVNRAKWGHFKESHPPSSAATAAVLGEGCQGGFRCEHCGKRLTKRTTLAAHVRTKHTGEKPFACDLCPATFPSISHLAQHKRNKHDDTPVQCAECGKICKNHAAHYAHMRYGHRLQATPRGSAPPPRSLAKQSHVCDKCARVFSAANSLQRHLITEHPANGVKPKFFQCKLCEQGFSLVASMRSHLRSVHAAQLWPPELLEQNKVTVTAPPPPLVPESEADAGNANAGAEKPQYSTISIAYSLENYFIRNKWSQLT